MLTLEERNSKTEKIREIVGEETAALLSEILAELLTDDVDRQNYIKELEDKKVELEKRNADIIALNGSLFRKVGEIKKEEPIEEEIEEKYLEISDDDIFDEKGDFKNA